MLTVVRGLVIETSLTLPSIGLLLSALTGTASACALTMRPLVRLHATHPTRRGEWDEDVARPRLRLCHPALLFRRVRYRCKR